MTRSSDRMRAIGITLLLVLSSHGCGDAPPVSSAAAGPRARAVRIERVEPRPVTTSLRVPGLVAAEARIELAFRVAGFVARFEVDAGDRVAAGQILAQLETDELGRTAEASRAAVARAEARARDAAQTFGRQRELLAEHTNSQRAHDRASADHEMAQAELAEARVQLEEARDKLSKATLRAPVAGWIERRLLEPHELARPQTPVLVLTQLDRVKVRAAVSDVRAAELRRGAHAWVTTPLHPGRRFEGRVARIDLAADSATRTLPFELELANPELALRPELAVEVEVSTGEPEMLILVPLTAVLRDVDTQPFCFVLSGDEEPRVLRRPVELGAIHGDRVEVSSGLAVGERLVARGQHFLRPDDPVRVVQGD